MPLYQPIHSTFNTFFIFTQHVINHSDVSIIYSNHPFHQIALITWNIINHLYVSIIYSNHPYHMKYNQYVSIIWPNQPFHWTSTTLFKNLITQHIIHIKHLYFSQLPRSLLANEIAILWLINDFIPHQNCIFP